MQDIRDVHLRCDVVLIQLVSNLWILIPSRLLHLLWLDLRLVSPCSRVQCATLSQDGVLDYLWLRPFSRTFVF